VKLARLRRPKATCSVSFVDYGPNKNETLVTLREVTHERGRETINLNKVDLPTIKE
jgi:hypothetical protein